MRRALELVKDGTAVAAVSAGNTGALMGLGVLLLRRIPGISVRRLPPSFPTATRSIPAACWIWGGA